MYSSSLFTISIFVLDIFFSSSQIFSFGAVSFFISSSNNLSNLLPSIFFPLHFFLLLLSFKVQEYIYFCFPSSSYLFVRSRGLLIDPHFLHLLIFVSNAVFF